MTHYSRSRHLKPPIPQVQLDRVCTEVSPVVYLYHVDHILLYTIVVWSELWLHLMNYYCTPPSVYDLWVSGTTPTPAPQ